MSDLHKLIAKLSKAVLLMVTITFVTTGCGFGDDEAATAVNATTIDALEADAIAGLQESISADYIHLSIISGGLKKLNSSSDSSLVIGKVLGAIEGATFARNYEYRRLDENLNIPVEVKRKLVGPGLLTALNRNFEVLEHLNKDVLSPYSEYLSANRELTADQEKAVDRTESLMEQLTEEYRQLANNKESSREQEQEHLKVITKLQQELITIYFPTEVNQ